MNIALFSANARIAIAIAAAVLVVATVIAARRRARVGALFGVMALAAVGALAGEALVALTVRLAASDTADFNEYRWVFLSPWGRLGLWLGGAAVAAIVALSWRASRGAATWRRALLVALRGGAAAGALVMLLEPAVELRQVAREPNRIAILIDDSRSMALAEDPSGPTRIERVRQMLAASSSVLADRERDHKLDYFTFSDTLTATTLAGLATDPAAGTQTLIRKALDSVRAR